MASGLAQAYDTAEYQDRGHVVPFEYSFVYLIDDEQYPLHTDRQRRTLVEWRKIIDAFAHLLTTRWASVARRQYSLSPVKRRQLDNKFHGVARKLRECEAESRRIRGIDSKDVDDEMVEVIGQHLLHIEECLGDISDLAESIDVVADTYINGTA